MERIEGQLPDQAELAKEVLSWIICAERRLTTVKLQHALAVKVGQNEFDEENIPNIEDIVSICAGLVTVDEEGATIRLVHYTTQEYLERTLEKWFPNANIDMCLNCLVYLSFTAVKSGPCLSDSSFDERLQLNPLFDYAAKHWDHHVRPDSNPYEKISNFIQCEPSMEAAVQTMWIVSPSHRYFNDSQEFPQQMTGLHLAANFGNAELLKILLKSVYVDSRNSAGRAPLSYVAAKGQATAVKLFLEARADIESKDTKYDQTPLSWAAKNEHEAVVKLLIAANADIEWKDGNGQTPLSLAAVGGHDAVIKLLLNANVKLDLKDNRGQNELSWAARHGRDGVVKLLEANADIESKDIRGRTPLSWAARDGRDVVIKLLFDAGADMESKDNNGRTPLSWAAEEGNESVVNLFVEAGAEAESKDNDGQTPMFSAIEYYHKDVIELLQSSITAFSNPGTGNCRSSIPKYNPCSCSCMVVLMRRASNLVT